MEKLGSKSATNFSAVYPQ